MSEGAGPVVGSVASHVAPLPHTLGSKDRPGGLGQGMCHPRRGGGGMTGLTARKMLGKVGF